MLKDQLPNLEVPDVNFSNVKQDGVVVEGEFYHLLNALEAFATNQKTPLCATPMGVVAFILAGMNHCIADFYYMCASLTFTYTLLATIIGNILGGLTFNAKINH